MIDYGVVRGATKPAEREFTATTVLIATDIQPYTEEVEERVESGYEYHYVCYDKDEYINLLASKNEELEATVLDTQMALCDLYDLIDGGASNVSNN